MNTIGELLDRNEAHYPHKCAFAMGTSRLSYAEYGTRVRRLAAALCSLGLRPQDRAGCVSMNRLEYFELYGACEHAGYILANYNFRSAPPELAYLLEDSAPHIVFFESQYAATLGALRSRFPDILHFVCLDDPVPDWALGYSAVMAEGDPAGTPFASQPGHTVYLFYTSGTTGRPKGVPWTHRTALHMARMHGRLLHDDATVLTVTPAFHIGGKTMPLGALWNAGTTILQRAFSPIEWLDVVQRERVTDTFMVAPMIQAVLDLPELESYDRSSLRSIMSAAAPLSTPLLMQALRRLGSVIYIAYGSTETGGIAQLERHEIKPDGSPQELDRLKSVGHFYPEIEADILDDAEQPCAPRVVGEVCVKSTVFEGYWNNSIATIEARRGGWFHTGDMGYVDEERFVYLIGRKKDMIISGGENIYSREVEDALMLHPAVAEAAVIGMPDARWGESVNALVVLRHSRSATESELLEHCRAHIARYKCPKTFEFLDKLPRLSTGKIDKLALRKKQQEGT